MVKHWFIKIISLNWNMDVEHLIKGVYTLVLNIHW